MRLNKLDEAERTFRYMRHLECTDVDSYLKLASVQERRGEFDKEAVSLMQVILLDSTHQEAWQALNEVFKRINHEQLPCIIMSPEGRAQLDLSRETVRETVLEAYRDFVRTFLMAKRPKLAESAGYRGQDLQVPLAPGLFDPLFDPEYQKQSFIVPVPTDPIYWKPAKVKFELMMPEVKEAILSQTNGVVPDELGQEIVDGRSIYTLDQPRRIRVSEEGKVLP